MVSLIVQYKIAENKLEIVKSAIGDFVTAVKNNEPETLRYEAFQMRDKASFIHFMSFKDEDAKIHHQNTPYVKEFVETLYPNCDEPPEFTEVDLI